MRKLRFLVCLLALAGVPSALYAQINAASAKAGLPAGESIMDRFVEATGGVEAYKKLNNVGMKGSVDMTAMGIKGDVTIYSAAPNLNLTEMTIPGLGKMQEGVDGKLAWSYNAMQGPSIKSGAEAEQELNSAHFRTEEWRTQYSRVETQGLDSVDGEECYRVMLTPKAGPPIFNCYSRNSGLLLKSTITTISEMGTMEVDTILRNYKKVGDFTMPFQLVQGVAGMTVTINFSEITFNADIPMSIFDPPAEVKALIK